MTDRLRALYRRLPMGVKRYVTPVVLRCLAPLMFTEAAQLWFVRFTGRRGVGALMETPIGASGKGVRSRVHVVR